jgi:hypothetical protein
MYESSAMYAILEAIMIEHIIAHDAILALPINKKHRETAEIACNVRVTLKAAVAIFN